MKTERNIHSGIRRLALMLFSVVGLLLASACSEDGMEGFEGAAPKEGYITINLSNTSMRTRDTESDDRYNENRIQRANIYLFKATAGDDDTPVLTHSISPNAVESTSVQIKLNRDIIADLFPEGSQNKALAYVVANLPAAYSFPEVITLGSLRTLPITSNFATATQQNSFIMNGEGTLTLSYDTANPSKSSVEGEVHLQRAASKITLAVSLTDEVTDGNGVTWRPVTASMNVLINNGVDKSKVNPTYESDDIGYFSTSTANNTQIGFTNSGNADDEFPWNVNLPLYTYPNKWSEENQEDMTFLTLNVQWTNGSVYRNCYYMVPVVKDSQLVRNTSYRVMINVGILGNYTPEEPLELTDVSYRAVDWGAAPVDVDIADYRYLVVDRDTYVVNNENSYNISFYSSHEVVVTNVTMTYYLYNTSSQGDEYAIEISMEQNEESATHNNGKGVYSYEVDNNINSLTGTRQLTLDHELLQWTPINVYGGGEINLGPTVTIGSDGNYSYTYKTANQLSTLIENIWYYTPTNKEAYSRYEFEITIAHKDDESNREVIKIIQYPGQYIEATKNYAGNSASDNIPTRTNVYVNSNQSEYTGTANYWCRVRQSGSGNPNLYVITITNLNDNRYYIGETRQSEIDNLTYNNNTSGYLTSANQGTAPDTRWSEAPALYGTSPRRLTYYYPTNSDDAYMYRIAPKFRVSSYYSASVGLSDINAAKRRCAGYQEMGYPAGRWRLPTVGELEYIINLWLDNKIPRLFMLVSSGGGAGASSYYWTAQGPVPAAVTDEGRLDTSYLKGNVPAATFTRCVYDEWYWEGSTVESTATTTAGGDTYNTYPFTWGDAPIEINN